MYNQVQGDIFEINLPRCQILSYQEIIHEDKKKAMNSLYNHCKCNVGGNMLSDPYHVCLFIKQPHDFEGIVTKGHYFLKMVDS